MTTLATNPGFNRELKDEGGDPLSVRSTLDGAAFILEAPEVVLRFPNTDAPAVALAILTAAGFVPRGNRVDPDNFQQCVDTAAGHLDDAVLIADGEAAKKELTRRRDELAKQLTPLAATYSAALPAIQTAIDMIIQLQNEATA